MRFPVNFVKFLKTPFSIEHRRRLLLKLTEVTNKRRRPIDGVLNPFRYLITVVVFAGSDLYRVENIYTKLFGNR